MNSREHDNTLSRGHCGSISLSVNKKKRLWMLIKIR